MFLQLNHRRDLFKVSLCRFPSLLCAVALCSYLSYEYLFEKNRTCVLIRSEICLCVCSLRIILIFINLYLWEWNEMMGYAITTWLSMYEKWFSKQLLILKSIFLFHTETLLFCVPILTLTLFYWHWIKTDINYKSPKLQCMCINSQQPKKNILCISEMEKMDFSLILFDYDLLSINGWFLYLIQMFKLS